MEGSWVWGPLACHALGPYAPEMLKENTKSTLIPLIKISPFNFFSVILPRWSRVSLTFKRVKIICLRLKKIIFLKEKLHNCN